MGIAPFGLLVDGGWYPTTGEKVWNAGELHSYIA